MPFALKKGKSTKPLGCDVFEFWLQQGAQLNTSLHLKCNVCYISQVVQAWQRSKEIEFKKPLCFRAMPSLNPWNDFHSLYD